MNCKPRFKKAFRLRFEGRRPLVQALWRVVQVWRKWLCYSLLVFFVLEGRKGGCTKYSMCSDIELYTRKSAALRGGSFSSTFSASCADSPAFCFNASSRPSFLDRISASADAGSVRISLSDGLRSAIAPV